MMLRTPAGPRERGGAKAVLLVALVVVAGALAAWRLTDETGTRSFVQADFERRVGAEIAQVVMEFAAGRSGGRVGVLLLSPHDRGPYAERLAALTEKLAEAGRPVGKYDALSGATELYGGRDYEDDYSPSIDAALEKLSPDVLVVLTAGGFTHARVSPAMANFVSENGRFVFVGQVFQADSPVLGLIRDGAALAVARNTGPLAARSPQTRKLDARDPDDYVRKYYTVLRPDNVGGLTKPAR